MHDVVVERPVVMLGTVCGGGKPGSPPCTYGVPFSNRAIVVFWSVDNMYPLSTTWRTVRFMWCVLWI